jgi:hypothetical protein
MTIRSALAKRKSAFPVGIAFGVVFGGIAGVRGDLAFAAFALGLMSVFGAVLAFAPTEWAVSQSGEADERQRALNDEAVRCAYGVVVVVAVVGAGVELWRGDPGPFTLISAVGGFTHMGALAILGRRR